MGPAMIPDKFTAFRTATPARSRGCWTCTNFHGSFYADHLLCERDHARQVIGSPRDGCAFWMREIGADDE
jgi:hypothetical protein